MGVVNVGDLGGDQIVIHFGGALTSVDAYRTRNCRRRERSRHPAEHDVRQRFFRSQLEVERVRFGKDDALRSVDKKKPRAHEWRG